MFVGLHYENVRGIKSHSTTLGKIVFQLEAWLYQLIYQAVNNKLNNEGNPRGCGEDPHNQVELSINQSIKLLYRIYPQRTELR